MLKIINAIANTMYIVFLATMLALCIHVLYDGSTEIDIEKKDELSALTNDKETPGPVKDLIFLYLKENDKKISGFEYLEIIKLNIKLNNIQERIEKIQ